MLLEHNTRLYVPTGPVGLLDEVKDWLKSQCDGYTITEGQGAWHNGQEWVEEPVVILDIWTEFRMNVTPFMTLLALFNESAGFATVDGVGWLEDLATPYQCDMCKWTSRCPVILEKGQECARFICRDYMDGICQKTGEDCHENWEVCQ